MRESLQKEKLRYENRESRTEDVELIKRLTSDNQDLRKKMEQLREQNKLFKLELTNREDNLNKLFGNVPKVGVINPLGATKSFSTSEARTASKSTKLKPSSSVSKTTFPPLNMPNENSSPRSVSSSPFKNK